MHRLFVAIRPPVEVRTKLLSLMHGIAGARWQADDQLHLTLRFIGEVDGRSAEDLATLLGTIRFTPFAIAVSGLGCFERKGRAETIWAAVQPREPLAQLYQKIDRACKQVGLRPDERAYLPHITLARLNRSTGPVDPFMAQHAGLASPPFTVDSFGLFESRLTPTGAHYHMAATYPADGRSAGGNWHY